VAVTTELWSTMKFSQGKGKWLKMALVVPKYFLHRGRTMNPLTFLLP
jgi:hypothetical protein